MVEADYDADTQVAVIVVVVTAIIFATVVCAAVL